MDFDSALLSIDAFGATEFNALNDVMFSGSILPSPVQAESFSFAFTNQVAVGGGCADRCRIRELGARAPRGHPARVQGFKQIG